MSINLLIDKPKISTLTKVQLFRNTNQVLRLPEELIYELEKILLGDCDTIYYENELRKKALNNRDFPLSFNEISLNENPDKIFNDYMPANLLLWGSHILMLSEGDHIFKNGFIYALLDAYDERNLKEKTLKEVKILDNMINFMIFNYGYSELLFEEISNTLNDLDKYVYIKNATESISDIKTMRNTKNYIENYIKRYPNYEIDNYEYEMDYHKDIDIDDNPYVLYTLIRIGNPEPIDIKGLAPEIIMKDAKLTVSKQAIDRYNFSNDKIKKINDTLRAIEIINGYINIYRDTH